MKKLLLMLMMLVLSIPIWASEHTVVINRGEVLEQGNVSGVLAYYCVKDGIMMTFTGRHLMNKSRATRNQGPRDF